MSITDRCCSIIYGEAYLSTNTRVGGFGRSFGLSFGRGHESSNLGQSLGDIEIAEISPEHSFIKRFGHWNNKVVPTCVHSRFGEVGINITFLCLNREVLINALYANSNQVIDSGSSRAEQFYIGPNGLVSGEFIRLANLPAIKGSIVVKLVSGVIETTLQERINYKSTSFGIELRSNFTTADGEYLKIEYTSEGSKTCFDALEYRPEPVKLTFLGYNGADERERIMVDVWNVLFSPASVYKIIENDPGFESVTLQGILVPDMRSEHPLFRTCIMEVSE